MATDPASKHVKVGADAYGLLNLPEALVQLHTSGPSPVVRPSALRATVPPTGAWSGFKVTLVTRGQTRMVPETLTLPFGCCWWQSRARTTEVVWPATME